MERFWSKVDVRGPDECWPWTASKMRRGYGQFSLNGGTPRAHRLAYELTFGPIPEGLQVDHTCHDPMMCQLGDMCPHRACCNPDHLKLATNAENHAPGRVNGAAGARALWRSRTPEQRRAHIAKMHAARWA